MDPPENNCDDLSDTVTEDVVEKSVHLSKDALVVRTTFPSYKEARRSVQEYLTTMISHWLSDQVMMEQ